ncbi:sensor domain-containing diguanylate cyclase [Sulfurospirillum arcachonense]|uniref:sensor domain-containing diguanylate cyclase n=1 Tax=Sulfurospirillum arcachonense TaxID=57666 RepID=UPI0004689C85|nr:diguanylate cyclase [Sulfurospirillum arcachonense]
MSKIKRNTLVNKLIPPLFLYLILLAVISIGSLYYIQKKHAFNIAENTFLKTTKLLDKKFKSDIKTYKTFIKLISKDKQAIELFQSNNREGLYNYYKKTFEEFNKQYKISHFYFHKTSKINFLRMHYPQKHSDLIERFTLNASIKNRGLGKGIEFGIFHNLTLRVVYPWFVNNKIIGYIELGKEIDYLTPELAKLTHSEIVFTINKKNISKENYQKWLDNSKKNVKFKELKNYYIIDSSIHNYSKKLKVLLNNQENIHHASLDNFSAHYHINSKPFLDAHGKEIGKIYILCDMSDEFKFLLQLIFKITFIIILLFAFLAIYYLKIVRKEATIIEKTQTNMFSLAMTDSLTSLYNKRHFDSSLPLKIQKAQSNDNYISFIIADIDNFKKYNDNYGHKKGDDVLKRVAHQIKYSFKRSNDLCHRIGGEEFAIIVESDNKNFGYKMAEKMRKNVEKLKIEHLYNEQYNKVTISIGIFTINSKDIVDYDNLFINADKALYQAKKSGRNCTISA